MVLPERGTTSRLIKIGKELGVGGSCTGIGARLSLTAVQFALYIDIMKALGATRCREGSGSHW